MVVSGSLPTASQGLKATTVPPAFVQANSLIRMKFRDCGAIAGNLRAA